MNQAPEPLPTTLSTAARAVVEHALARGYLTAAGLRAALGELPLDSSGGELLQRLGQSLSPAQLAELRAVYQALDVTLIMPQEGGAPAAGGSGRPSSTSASALEWIGSYKIERELARGGMGVVYVARDTKLDRRVAIKVQTTGKGSERFLIEAQAAARLRHPNIVAVHEVGQVGARPYLVMELVEGESLRSRIGREGPLPLDESARLAATIARAVDYAHSRSILHRDIKPHNVLLDGAKPLLTDFGLAKDISGEVRGLTVTGQLLGTPAYMPPEQANGDLKRIDGRTDVYSLGATLYEMLTGEPPFRGVTAMNTLVKVLHQPPRPPSELRLDLDSDLERICLKCLEKDSADRYGSASQLAADLDRYSADEPVEARPIGGLQRLARRARRNPAFVSLAVALLAVVIGGVGYAVALKGSAPAVALQGSGPSSSTLPLPPIATDETGPLWDLPPGTRLRFRTLFAERRETKTVTTESFEEGVVTLSLGVWFVASVSRLPAGRIEMDVEIEAAHVQYKQNELLSGDFDTRTGQPVDSPLRDVGAVVGKQFSFLLDPETGAVADLQGVDAFGKLVVKKIEAGIGRSAPIIADTIRISFTDAFIGRFFESLFHVGGGAKLADQPWKVDEVQRARWYRIKTPVDDPQQRVIRTLLPTLVPRSGKNHRFHVTAEARYAGGRLEWAEASQKLAPNPEAESREISETDWRFYLQRPGDEALSDYGED